MELRKLDFILNQLQSYSGEKKQVGETIFVSCPFHSEKTPSFRIFVSPTSKSPGWGKCYGCGQKTAWDNYAEKLGLKPYKWSKPEQQFARPLIRADEFDSGSSTDQFTFYDLPAGKVWRHIKTDLLIDIGCKQITQYNTKFIYMPVNILGNERGYIRARMRKEADKPSYLNKKGRWSEHYGLFPFDYTMRNKPKSVVLVEGPRDALRLLSFKIPALAILGTQSWSKRKSSLIEIAGVKNVIMCFDGDSAGLKAREVVRPNLEKLVKVETFDLCGKDSPYWPFRNREDPGKDMKKRGVEGWDPGNMPLSKVKELASLVSKLNHD